MTMIRPLLGRGNGKLGEAVYTWSLPAVTTCPGRSPVCARHCYARHGRFRTRAVRAALRRNLRAARRDDFPDRMTREIRRRGAHVVRIHVAGDFYDAAYACKWLRVLKRCPRTTFYTYTRSWREPAILPVLAALAACRNVRLWFSCDAAAAPPARVPAGVRLAYLQADEAEVPGGTRLVFRVRRLRGQRPRRVSLSLVCPGERPGLPTTCSECQRCWQEA